jgi:bacterioferritin
MELTSRQKVLLLLDSAYSAKLYVIWQYMAQYYSLVAANREVEAQKLREIARQEMFHAELLGLRIKELGGNISSDLARSVSDFQDLKNIYYYNSNLEAKKIEDYKQIYVNSITYGDYITATLFTQLLEDENKHKEYFFNKIKF